MKAKKVLAIIMALLLCMPAVVYAADGSIVKEYPFESETKDFSYSAPKAIEENGKKYELKDTKYEIVRAPSELKRIRTYTNLAEKKVPKKTLKLKSGETLKLSDVAWTEQTRTAGSGTLTVTGSDSRPDVPETKEITATLPDGSTITVTGQLTSVEKTGSSYSKPFSVKATFTGDEDVDTYMMGDTAIPNNPDSPAFSGYETAILTHLGLDPDQYKITDARWTSGYVKRNGQTVRYAEYSGQRLTSDWTAYYTETITADSPQVTTYTAEATYISTDDNYEVMAVCTYEATHNLLPVIIGIGIGVCILALVIVIILQILKKKKGVENENSN